MIIQAPGGHGDKIEKDGTSYLHLEKANVDSDYPSARISTTNHPDANTPPWAWLRKERSILQPEGSHSYTSAS